MPKEQTDRSAPEIERQLGLYETMQVIRITELTLSKLFADSEIPGFIHLSVGQEGVAAGVIGALHKIDTFATTHRGHGHVLAKGVSLELFFKEIMGKAGGICRGRGGSMHVADFSLGVLGANGIVGGGLPLATGSALAHKARKTNGVAVAVFGDGAMAEGVLHECLNMAALWQLPLVFVCENNGWSEFSPTSRQFAGSLKALAAAFGLDHTQVNGNDVYEVSGVASKVLDAARKGKPQILECFTTRWHGHFEGDPQTYRPPEELKELADVDPIKNAATRLLDSGVSESELIRIEKEVRMRVETALEVARKDPVPEAESAFQDVYTPRTNSSLQDATSIELAGV